MAKPHKHAWNGIDFETSLSVEQVANMAQRAASESTGDLLRGKHRIVSVKSTDRDIEFRINDFLISFNRFMVFTLAFTVSGGRTFGSSTIDWFMTSQSTVGGFIPVSTKSMVAHHTYLQFITNLAAQLRAADPSARITIREGVQPHAPAPAAVPVVSSAPPLAATPAYVPAPPPPASYSAPVPLPPTASSDTPVPLPPPPAAASGTVPPPPPPPATPAPLPLAPLRSAGLVTSIPGARPSAPPPVPPPPALPSLADIDPLAAQLFADDDDLDSTRMSQSAGARPWVLAFSDGQTVRLGPAIVIGRDPLAHGGARPVPVADPAKSVSKTHATIEGRDGLLWVTDLHSTNGTSVTNAIGEATSCPPDIAMPVGDGWSVSVGEFVIIARLGL